MKEMDLKNRRYLLPNQEKFPALFEVRIQVDMSVHYG